jgi:lipopolysaccharide transport system permease protein
VDEVKFDTLIEPKVGWIPVDWRELYKFRELTYIFVWRDIKIRYKQTLLGAAWAVLQPFISMIVFTIFFGKLAKVPSENLPYAIFVYTGLLPWTFFANSLSAASDSLIGQSSLISKVYFPRLLIPISTLGAFVLDFLVSLALLVILMFYYQIIPGWTLLIAPLLFAATMVTAAGVGTFLAALCVAYRDVRYVVPFLIQIWMFVTPVIYPASMVPDRWRWVLSLNPMYGLVDGFRSALLGRPLNVQDISVALVISGLLLWFGLIYFKRVERRFADII